MKDRNFNIPTDKPRVLIAPLDWGLGHATRCIPIIFKLLQKNCEVIIAAEGVGKLLLQKEFPALEFIHLKGYRVSYSRSKALMPLKMLLQFPKIIYRIYAENRWLKQIVRSYKIDAVISENRMGLYHSKVPCIYITHQLKIKTGNPFTEKIAQKIHYHFINKFSACWVPDIEGDMNLAGDLSHPSTLPKVPVKYIGPLSRFEKTESTFKYDLCIILSGPEPQRTVFEKIILKGLDKISGNIFLLRGLPGNTMNEKSTNNIDIKNHLSAGELNLVIQQSKMIISRCGYSTVMDLVKLQKRAVLVPTPGQTEQEYLANYLSSKKVFYCISQADFILQDAMKEAGLYEYKNINIPLDEFKKEIELFVVQLKQINNAGT